MLPIFLKSVLPELHAQITFMYHVVGIFLTSQVRSSLLLRWTKTEASSGPGMGWHGLVTELNFESMSKWMMEEQWCGSCWMKILWHAGAPPLPWSVQASALHHLLRNFRVTAPGVDYEADERIARQFPSWSIFLFFLCWVTCKIPPSLLARGKNDICDTLKDSNRVVLHGKSHLQPAMDKRITNILLTDQRF